jgi:energy-coupling factor transporter ATP-binding protein EcfA2
MRVHHPRKREQIAATATSRLHQRLLASGKTRFVGRDAEIALFRDAIGAAKSPFAVLYVHGPGGVGKTTLLREWRGIAQHHGRHVVSLDGRDIEASNVGFQQAFADAVGSGARAVPADSVILIDTYERIAAIDAWLREEFLPQLPARCLVVLAGRTHPAPEWRTDIAWAGLTRRLPLSNLEPQAAEAYLAARGVSADRRATGLEFTHGHPLALSLVADVLIQHGARLELDRTPDVIGVLVDCFLRDVPSVRHRHAIEVCAQVRNTTEALLAAALEGDDASQLFEWLRRLSFVEEGPHGIFPHDLARDAFIADTAWREPLGHQERYARTFRYLVDRIRQSSGREQQRRQMEYLFLVRNVPTNRDHFDLSRLDAVYAEPARPADAAFILATVRKYEGEVSERIARHWFGRQPEAFLVFRDVSSKSFGFMAQIDISQATEADRAIDPAIRPALALIERFGANLPGAVNLHLRFWMDADTYKDPVTPAFNLVSMNTVKLVLTRQNLALNFVPWLDPSVVDRQLAAINFVRAPDADFEVDGQHYSVFAHDWRVENAEDWVSARLGERPFKTMPFVPGAAQSCAATPMARGEFESAVRDALRAFVRRDQLAGNPLRHALGKHAHGKPLDVEALQSMLRQAVSTLKSDPRDEKLYRALWYTFIEPLASQERVAERLDLPFSTYRYHLTKGLERVVAALWHRCEPV